MLILSRKARECILLRCDQGQIRFKIIEVGRERVSIGVEAPDNVKILREELETEPTDN